MEFNFELYKDDLLYLHKVDERGCIALLHENYNFFRFMSDAQKTEKVCKVAVSLNGHLIRHLPKYQFISNEIIDLAYRSNPASLGHLHFETAWRYRCYAREQEILERDGVKKSRAEWMCGEWGVRVMLPSPLVKNYFKFDQSRVLAQLAQYTYMGYVMIHLSQAANGFYFTGYNPTSALIDSKLGLPNGTTVPWYHEDHDVFAKFVEGCRNMGLRIMVYIAGQGPTMKLHNEPFPEGYDVAFNDYAASQGFTPAQGFARLIVQYYAERYGDKIDAWWVDHGNHCDPVEITNAIRKGNPNAAVTFNMEQVVPLTKQYPDEDFTSGHVVGGGLHSMDWETLYAPRREQLQKDCFIDGSLGHMFLPIIDGDNYWWRGNVAKTDEEVIDWCKSITDAGGALTWSIALDPHPLGAIQSDVHNQLVALNDAYWQPGDVEPPGFYER